MKDDGIDPAHQTILKDRIAELLPLRSIAADRDAANVEIVCDAAISCLDCYNREHSDNPVDEKWMYISVQCLACLDLKPSLVRGTAPRLPLPNKPPPEAEPSATTATSASNDSSGVANNETPQHDDDTVEQEGSSSRASTAYHESLVSLRPGPDLKRNLDGSSQDEVASSIAINSDGDGEAQPVAQRSSTPSSKKRRSNAAQVANAKETWGDEDVSKLIKLKMKGMTHKEIGAILSRTEPACAIRHSIVLRKEKWIDFAKAYREKKAAGEASDEEGEPAKKVENIAPVEGQKIDVQAVEVKETPQHPEGADNTSVSVPSDGDPGDEALKE
ncbi:hypothetical protein DHEL01_v206726 [Diaporthe helianthi]|uniref:Myb-like domain-containing protein n=1 Tax=Diaporthe helianthi TaxID=158607 RepID=A0A2P5HX96_DIAHE|nr:hypothetical protein DHEL01_v206726 [Diaporthe helianthi]